MTLYISKLKQVIKSKKYSVNEIADMISISGNGLHLALKNNTLKVRDLVKIAEILDVEIGVLFEDTRFFEDLDGSLHSIKNTQKGTGNYIQQGNRKTLNEDAGKYKTENEVLKEKVKGLDERLKLKDEIIELLKK